MKSEFIKSFFILVFMIFASCKSEEVLNNDTNQAVKVKCVQAKAELISDSLRGFGSITYSLKNSVTCLQGGELVYFPFKEGDLVKKNQVIAKLKNLQLQYQKEQFQNNLETARHSLNVAMNELREHQLSVESRLLSLEKTDLSIRQKENELDSERETLKIKRELHNMGGVTDFEIKQLELREKAYVTDILLMKKEQEISSLGLRDSDLFTAGYPLPQTKEERFDYLLDLNTKSIRAKIDAAKIELKNAQNALDAVNNLISELTVRSPIEGIIGARNYEAGEYVKENSTLLTVIDISSVYAVILVQEKDMVKCSSGSEVEIEIPSLSKRIDSSICEISPVADSQSGNFSVKALVKNEDFLIKPGMFFTCKVKQDKEKTLVKIPHSAVMGKAGEEKVFLIRNDYLVLSDVSVFKKQEGYTWVFSGLNDGDLIVDKPSPFLREGQHVIW